MRSRQAIVMKSKCFLVFPQVGKKGRRFRPSQEVSLRVEGKNPPFPPGLGLSLAHFLLRNAAHLMPPLFRCFARARPGQVGLIVLSLHFKAKRGLSLQGPAGTVLLLTPSWPQLPVHPLPVALILRVSGSPSMVPVPTSLAKEPARWPPAPDLQASLARPLGALPGRPACSATNALCKLWTPGSSHAERLRGSGTFCQQCIPQGATPREGFPPPPSTWKNLGEGLLIGSD